MDFTERKNKEIKWVIHARHQYTADSLKKLLPSVEPPVSDHPEYEDFLVANVGFCRGSRVQGRMSRVEAKLSRVEGSIFPSNEEYYF